MRRANHNIIEIGVTLKHQTDKALLVVSEITGKEAWVPKSACEYQTGTLQIPEPMAVDKELV